MRQDWIEFEENDGGKTYVRIKNITAFHSLPKVKQDGYNIVVSYNFGGVEQKIAVIGDFEQVKQKIMDAEKVDLSDVVVEHFTKEEYEKLLSAVQIQVDNCTVGHLTAQVNKWRKLENKLNEILKENK